MLEEKDIRDHSELEGKVIDWKETERSIPVKVKVVGFDYNVGITMVNAENDKEYYACFHGPLSPLIRKRITTSKDKADHKKYWNKTFESCLGMVRSGCFNIYQHDIFMGQMDRDSTATPNCAFGQ